MRVLVVTNFVPDAAAPQRGRWVRDQVEEIRRLGVEGLTPPGRRCWPARDRCSSTLRSLPRGK
jgi:hypothetical protein